MAKINQALLDRLADKLSVSRGRVYALIQDISNKNRVPRHLGALLLAGDNRISVQKYATRDELAELRGIPSHVSVAVPSPAAPQPRAPGRKVSNKRGAKPKENTVFVVHGRDENLRDSTYQFLGALGLQPREWGHALRAARRGGGNPFINDAVVAIMEQAQAIVVLLSPDDQGMLRPQFVQKNERASEGKLRGQARANVVFETGIAIGAHHRKTLIVQVGDVKPFTDISGMHIVRVSNTSTARHNFANRLEDIGCKVDRAGDQWLKVGDFTPTTKKKRKTRR